MSAFSPYRREFVNDFFKRKGDDDYHRGWEFRRDQAQKPLGWIAESAQRQHEVVDLIAGQVSVDYLASYENAGIVEIWLSELSYLMPLKLLKCSKWKISSEKRERICYDNSAEKLKLYPHLHGMGHTHTQTLDTFIDMSTSEVKFSEITTKTFSLNATGMLLLHLLHRPLPAEVMSRRKGDKVKILGVSSC